MNTRLKTVKGIDKTEFIDLYKDAGWWKREYDNDTSFIPNIVSGSTVFVTAEDESGKTVGMGRAVSDGCSDAYIQDVVVLESHRGQGIGGRIIRHIICELRKKGIDWIGLIGEPGTESFYMHLGFRRMDKYIPMKLECE